jgi:restriction endonuclease S subunit
MEESINKIQLKGIDKSTWNTFDFDQIAFHINERVEPTQTDLEIYVGLEHLDPDSIHIERFGKREDVKGTKLRVYPGDIIFGRRRAYQRKAAIAEFNGFCSAHALVLRANPEVIDPKFFPFFLHSDTFIHRAVDISVGSLSPTINWGTLKKQEFLLPPKEQQARLAELFWAADELVEKEYQLLSCLNLYYKTLLKRSITQFILEKKIELKEVKSLFQTRWENANLPSQWDYMLLRDALIEFQNGFAEGKRETNGIPQLRMNNVTRESRLDLSEVARIPDRKGISNYYIKKNDVLFNNTNSEDLVGKSILWNNQIENITFSNHFTRLRPNTEKLLPKYLHLWIKYHFDISLFERRCTKWIGQAAVQTENLLSLYILLPTISEQEYICNISNKIEAQIERIESYVKKLISVQKSLINQIF